MPPRTKTSNAIPAKSYTQILPPSAEVSITPSCCTGRKGPAGEQRLVFELGFPITRGMQYSASTLSCLCTQNPALSVNPRITDVDSASHDTHSRYGFLSPLCSMHARTDPGSAAKGATELEIELIDTGFMRPYSTNRGDNLSSRRIDQTIATVNTSDLIPPLRRLRDTNISTSIHHAKYGTPAHSKMTSLRSVSLACTPTCPSQPRKGHENGAHLSHQGLGPLHAIFWLK